MVQISTKIVQEQIVLGFSTCHKVGSKSWAANCKGDNE